MMNTRTDVSYGVIPVRRQRGNWEVLVINQYSRTGDNSYWIFPKGHPHEGEIPEETIRRELLEETGLRLKTLWQDASFTSTYTFVWDKEVIEKRVVFSVGEVESGEVSPDQDEVKEVAWLPLAEAMDRLTYENSRSMFAKAIECIEGRTATTADQSV